MAWRLNSSTNINFPCDGCRERKKRPFRRMYGAAHYEGAVAEGIKLLKFHDKVALAKPLADVMADFAEAEMDCEAYDFLTPIC